MTSLLGHWCSGRRWDASGRELVLTLHVKGCLARPALETVGTEADPLSTVGAAL